MAAAGHRSNVEWLGCRRVEGLLGDRSALFRETANAALIRPGAKNQPERPASIYLPCAWNKSPPVCVYVCVRGMHKYTCDCKKNPGTLISRHLQRALYMLFRAQLFRFRVVFVHCLLKVKPFTSLPAMALLLRCFVIQIRITIKPFLSCVFFFFCSALL